VRVGLHSGPAVVGNIGAPGRVNFTVVGDTVNVAQRMSSSARSSCRMVDEVVVLVSGNTLAAVKDRASLDLSALRRPSIAT
jgi:class 3 adenylate cyclase